MVQEFHVVRCFKCQTFQVQQVKKAARWSCKLCGEKQTLLKEYGRGSGADCRRHVQKLNAMRGAVLEEEEHHTWSLWEQVSQDQVSQDQVSQDQVSQDQVSRWSKYLDPPEEALMDRQEPHCHNMSDRKRKRSCTPEQMECSTPNRTGPPSLGTTTLNRTGPPSLGTTTLNRTGPPSLGTTTLNRTAPPSLGTTTPNRTGPPSKKCINLSSVRTGPVSKWARFLSSDCQVQKWEGPSVSGVTDWSCHDITVRPRPPLPICSMFESGADFSFDDEFVTEPRL